MSEAGAIALNVAGYIVFSENWYGSTLWVNILVSIILVILPAVQFLHWNPQNSLLTTALVCLFVSYVGFICQYSYSNTDAMSRMSYGPLAVDIICSTFFFILAMYGSIMGGTGQVKVTRDGHINAAMGVASLDQTQDKNDDNYKNMKS